MLVLMDKQLGKPNLLTVIVLGLPGAALLATGFVLGATYGAGPLWALGLAMLLFGLLLFIGAIIMLIGWAVKVLRA
jgi:hypothetical protein